MTNLQELIDTANRLSQRLEQAASDEMKFGIDLCMTLESMAWQTFRLANDLNEIKSYT